MTLTQHSAPGSNAGFDYQFERALYWLSKSPAGFTIGIETSDDVSIQSTQGTLLLEQDKHSIQQDGEPFGDRSKGLWNTLATWIEALDTKEVPETTRFLMVTNKTLPECIAHQIGRAKSESEVADCVAALKKASQKPPKRVSQHMKRVMRSESKATLQRLISQCDLADASTSAAGQALREQTVSHLQLPAWCVAQGDSIVDELLGWLHKTALEAWQKNQPAWIQRDHFINQLHAIIDRRKRQIARERSEHLIEVTDAKVGENKGSRFVKQLNLITDDDTVVDSAIRDWVRCNIEKSRLSVEGNITDDDWRAFETSLHARWGKIRVRVIRMKQGVEEGDVGFEIFTETTEDYREKLAGSDTEQVYLTAGTYHRLADLLRVGWHPRFEELMSEGPKSS